MTYSVSIRCSALKALERIARDDRRRIVEAIDKLATNPSAGGVLKGELGGLHRIRVGPYRVVYELRDEVLMVLVVRIGHRREICR
jgi:mRNA interferase RelE/StbE